MRDIKYIIIHHSATSPPNDIDTAKNIIKRQMEDYNAGKIISPYTNTYHYMITANGEVVPWICECSVSGHCGNDDINKISIGICLLGNFQKETPTENQYKTLLKKLKELYNKYRFKDILGHRDIIETECPGNNLYNLIPNIRKEVFMSPIENWESEAIRFLYERGIVRDLDTHLQNHDKPLTTAQVSAIVMNLVNYFESNVIKDAVKNALIEIFRSIK